MGLAEISLFWYSRKFAVKKLIFMKIVFCGSSDFSLRVLEGMLENRTRPCLVITTPDRPKGRGYGVKPTPVKQYCERISLDCISPESLTDKSFLAVLQTYAPDLIVVASYGKIIPRAMLDLPDCLPIGIHPSLLPAFRGAAPIQRAILNGEKETGVSLFKIVKKLDAGPVLLQKKVDISADDDYFTLSRKLEQVSLRAFSESLNLICSGKYSFSPQDEGKATYAAKIEKNEGEIDWQLSSRNIADKIRALKAWPVAYAFYKQKRVQILEAKALEGFVSALPGEIVAAEKNHFSVACGQGTLKISLLKPEGKKEMSAESFICGYRIKKGSCFAQG